MKNNEQIRLEEHYSGKKKWLKWGPYLSERQWGTVREDYSNDGNAWDYLTHDQARSRAYRWGEEGIAGISDEFCKLCFSVALWNGKDPIVKERLFGLNGHEGNHGEDVKELYYYLDSTPTHSYMKHLYKYPQTEYPYADLIEQNRLRGKFNGEYEITDTGVFDNDRYFDVFTEYAKVSGDDILIKISVHNRGDQKAELTLLPTLWFRNSWSFGLSKEKPLLKLAEMKENYFKVEAIHKNLGTYHFYFDPSDKTLFSENNTNSKKLFDIENQTKLVKDSVNDAVVSGNFNLFENINEGTKFNPLYQLSIEPKGVVEIKLRLTKSAPQGEPLGADFEELFEKRKNESDVFYNSICVADRELNLIQRQAFAGMFWGKQFYSIDIPSWLKGDEGQPTPPSERNSGRNSEWFSLNNEDIISMPDKWEYPWYAAWDLAFHCVAMAKADVGFAKSQLILFLREWYMRPNGQLPAYEWNFSDVNPPVHAWACMKVYRIEKEQTGKGDIQFLKKAFQKLLINFTWWVNRKDVNDKNVFEGGFLGLDNIGVFDRSSVIPGNGRLEQADGTSWMAMYCLNMLDMALEIAQEDNSFEDVATKFFEHFVYIADSLNRIGENQPGAWNEEEGFFYDVLNLPNNTKIPLHIRSLVGLTTIFAVLVLDKERLQNVPDFVKRLKWFRKYRQKNRFHIVIEELDDNENILLSLTPRVRIEKMLVALLNKNEFFSPYGIRSVSKIHETPYVIDILGEKYEINYEPGESTSSLFGGNSNWRGPIWMPMNFLLVESLKELGNYYKKSVETACPSGCDRLITLRTVADDIAANLVAIFTPDADGNRPVNGGNTLYDNSPYFKDLILFHEYFHGDTGKGLGASHQTGWTGIVTELISQITTNE